MDETFDPVGHVISIGRRLVSSFEDASGATTSGQVGSARETPVRQQLENILPRGIGVGTGFVIDSFGGTSRQMDVILYEREYCPSFCINDDPTTAYYPCEGVIAVGEIKSTISSDDLKDTFLKLASVKRLRRFCRQENPTPSNPQATNPFRKYGTSLGGLGTTDEEFDQTKKPFDQIFGFALGGNLGISSELFGRRFAELTDEYGDHLSPNLVVTLDDWVMCPLFVSSDGENPRIEIAPQNANNMYLVRDPSASFQFLISRLSAFYSRGRTVELTAFQRYFYKDGVLSLPRDGELIGLG